MMYRSLHCSSIVAVLLLRRACADVSSAMENDSMEQRRLVNNLPRIRSFTFVASNQRVLTGSEATACSNSFLSPVGDLALVAMKDAGSNWCFTDGRYNHRNYNVQQGSLKSSDGSTYTAYRIHPPSTMAQQWVASGTAVYIRTLSSNNQVVQTFDGHGFSKAVLGSSVGGFTSTNIRADTLASPLIVVADSSAGSLSAWPTLSPNVQGALLTSDASFSISARRFQVGGRPFVPESDWIAGPGAHSANYGIPKSFFEVDRSDGREGVVWQDQTTHDVHMTWFAADLLSSQTTKILSGRDHLVAATSDGGSELVLVLVSETVPTSKYQATSAKAVKVSSVSGAVVSQKALDTSANGLNIHAFFTSGASMAWNRAAGRIGLCISRTMTRGSDGLNHQGAIAVVLDATTLNVVRNLGQTSGHSFANSLSLASDGNFLGMDLGDNYPRGVHVWKFSSSGSWQGKRNAYTFKTQHATSSRNNGMDVYSAISNSQTTYYKWSNDNNVYTELAHNGLVEVDNGILVFFAGERPPLDNSKVGARMNVPRNLGFAKLSKNLGNVLSGGATETGGFYNFGGRWTPQENKGVKFLTASTSIDESVSRPKTARLAKDRNLLMWEIWTKTNYVRTQAMVVDDDGVVSKPVFTISYPLRLPIADDLRVQNGRTIAYAGTSSGEIVRYELCVGSSCSTGGGTATTVATTTSDTPSSTSIKSTSGAGVTSTTGLSTSTKGGCDDTCRDAISPGFCRFADQAWNICSMAWWNTVVCKATCNLCDNGLPPCPRQASQQLSYSMPNDKQVLLELRAINNTFVPVSVPATTIAPVTQAFMGVAGDAKHASEPVPILMVLAAMSATFLK